MPPLEIQNFSQRKVCYHHNPVLLLFSHQPTIKIEINMDKKIK